MTMAFLSETTVVKQPDGKEDVATFRLLTKEEAGRVLALQDEVLHHERGAGYYYPLSAQEVNNMLGEQGITMGVLVEDRLVAFHTVLFPHGDESNLGRDVHLSAEAQMRVAHFEAVCVHPQYRGNGLQKKMVQRLIRCLNGTPYDLLFQTISPFNQASLRSSLATGFVICKLKPKYEQAWRYILFRRRDNPVQWEKESRIKIPLTDFSAQQSAYDEGYVGVGLLDEEDQVWVALAKAAPTSGILSG